MKSKKEIADYNHDKYITTPKYNKFTTKIFDLRLNRANVASKSNITNFIKKTDFDNKLLVFNKKNNSNKTRYVLVWIKWAIKKVKAISAKGLTKDLVNGYKTLNRARYFSSETM